jgi:moderate conductance mechanosensitive channel
MVIDNMFAQVIFTIALIVLAQIIIRETLGRIVRRIIRSHRYDTKAEELQREETLVSVFRTLSGAILWIVGVIIILGELHVHLATLLTGAGLIGVIVGFGAQNILKDYLAGIFVIMENQYRVGDIVSMTAGVSTPVSGVVEDISIRATRLRDLDGNLHIIPNGSAGIITNLSYKFAQVNLDIVVSTDSDIDKVEAIINELGQNMANDEAWERKIIEPVKFLRVDKFDNTGITIKAVGKVKPAAQWDVAGAFRRRLKVAFEKHHIEIALPQVTVHQSKK